MDTLHASMPVILGLGIVKQKLLPRHWLFLEDHPPLLDNG